RAAVPGGAVGGAARPGAGRLRRSGGARAAGRPRGARGGSPAVPARRAGAHVVRRAAPPRPDAAGGGSGAAGAGARGRGGRGAQTAFPAGPDAAGCAGRTAGAGGAAAGAGPGAAPRRGLGGRARRGAGGGAAAGGVGGSRAGADGDQARLPAPAGTGPGRSQVRAVMGPSRRLVAHGTRAPGGPRVIDRLAAAAAARLEVPVRVAYVDVIGPTVVEALRGLDGPVVALPAFLAAGYHVRTDLPEQVAASGRRDVVVGRSLGPAPELAAVMLERLRAAGWRPGARVVFAAAGSSDERALADVRIAARLLGRHCGQRLVPS